MMLPYSIPIIFSFPLFDAAGCGALGSGRSRRGP